jgi:hypothetical protein
MVKCDFRRIANVKFSVRYVLVSLHLKKLEFIALLEYWGS